MVPKKHPHEKTHSMAVDVGFNINPEHAVGASFTNRDNGAFEMCATFAMWKAMQDGVTAFSSTRGWTIKNLKPRQMRDAIEDLGAHVYAIDNSSDGTLELAAAWDDAVIGLSVHITSASGRRRMRRGARRETRRVNAATLLFARMQFTSRVENDPRHEQMCKLFRLHAVSNTERTRRKVYALVQTQMGLTLKAIGSIEEKLVRENYSPIVLDAFDHIAGDLVSLDPCGRLVLIHGPTGTGKTYLVQGLVEAVKGVRFVLVPPALVPQLTGPGLGELLTKQRITTCLLVEDADMLLAKRMTDNMSGVSAILNLAAGIFGTLSDVRIVCTTNAAKLEFDDAILRDGRLCRDIEIPLLAPEHANAIAQRLVKDDGTQTPHQYAKPRSLAQVYRDAHNSNSKTSKVETAGNGQKEDP